MLLPVLRFTTLTASNPKGGIRKSHFSKSSHKNPREDYDCLGLGHMPTPESIRVQVKGMGYFGWPELGTRGGEAM